MFKCRIAELIIEIHSTQPYVYEKCRDYICSDNEKSDMVITLTDEEIEKEGALTPTRREIKEFLAIYRKICSQLSRFDAFLIHGVAIDVAGDGYIFCAPSGTGKTTHMKYWSAIFGNDLTVINGDKPIIRLIDGAPVVYGTPWCGKEGLNKNTSSPLKNLCFIHRSESNETKKIDTDRAFTQLMSQIQLPDSPVEMLSLMELLEKLLVSCKKYDIFCNMSIDSAKTAYEVTSKGDKK